MPSVASLSAEVQVNALVVAPIVIRMAVAAEDGLNVA